VFDFVDTLPELRAPLASLLKKILFAFAFFFPVEAYARDWAFHFLQKATRSTST
jgi:hypothetical protein